MDEKEFEELIFEAPHKAGEKLLQSLGIEADLSELDFFDQEYRKSVDTFLRSLSPLVNIGVQSIAGKIGKKCFETLVSLELYVRLQTASICQNYLQSHIDECEQTIAKLTPLAQKCPELKQLLADKTKEFEDLKKRKGVVSQNFMYEIFRHTYEQTHKHLDAVTERTYSKWITGEREPPYGFPDPWYDVKKTIDFGTKYKRKKKTGVTVSYNPNDIKHNS